MPEPRVELVAWFKKWRVSALAGAGAIAEGSAYLLHDLAHQLPGWSPWLAVALGTILISASAWFGFQETRKLESATESARASQEFLAGWKRLVECMRSIVIAPHTERRVKLDRLKSTVVSTASRIGPNTRACFFELVKENREGREVAVLKCDDLWEGQATRQRRPREQFLDDELAGRRMFDMIGNGKPVFVRDTSTEPQALLRANRDYETFISVPVVAGERQFGFLGVDSTNVGDLAEHHVDALEQLAGLLATGLAIHPERGHTASKGSTR